MTTRGRGLHSIGDAITRTGYDCRLPLEADPLTRARIETAKAQLEREVALRELREGRVTQSELDGADVRLTRSPRSARAATR